MDSPFTNKTRQFKPQQSPKDSDSERISSSTDSLEAGDRDRDEVGSPGTRKLHTAVETEAERKKRKDLEAKRAELCLYMCRIDNAYKTAKYDTENNLNSLKDDIRKNPRRYENEWRNLQSWAKDLEDAEKRKEELKQIEAD